MKRLASFLLIIVLIAGMAFAQKNKTMKGSWSTEVQINPFEQNGNTFSLDGLKVRYFFSNKNALRLKFSFNSTKDKYTDEDQNYEDPKHTTQYNDKYSYKKGNFSIELGYERHFDLVKRLDAYVGGSIGLGKNFASTIIHNYSKQFDEYGSTITIKEIMKNYELKNGVITPNINNPNINYPNVNYPNISNAERASFNFNAAIFAGLEFYIYKGLYVGTELGIGYQSAKTLKMELDGKVITRTTANNKVKTDEDIIDEESTDNYRINNFKTYIEPKLRIGITF